MTLSAFIEKVADFTATTDCEGSIMIILLIGILSFIQVMPIEIDPWTWLAKITARALGITALIAENTKLHKEISDIKKETSEALAAQNKKIEDFRKEEREERELRDAIKSRRNISVFNDEILRNVRHSKEMFDIVLTDDIKPYKLYCTKHPEFKNGKTVFAEENIEKTYQKCLNTHDFL